MSNIKRPDSILVSPATYFIALQCTQLDWDDEEERY